LAYKMFVEKPERKRPLHDLEVEGTIILILWIPESFVNISSLVQVKYP